MKSKVLFLFLSLLSFAAFADTVELNAADSISLCHAQTKQFATRYNNFILNCQANGIAAITYRETNPTSDTSVGSSPLNDRIIYALLNNPQEATDIVKQMLGTSTSYVSTETILLKLNNGNELNEARFSLRCYKKAPNDATFHYCQAISVRD